MSIGAASILPFLLRLPSAYGGALASSGSGQAASATGSASSGSGSTATGSTTPQDVIDIQVPLPGGTFTADAGDSLGLRDLFSAGSDAWDSVALYRVALRDDPATPGGGRLLLRGEDVSSRTDFTPAEFNELQFVAGPDGARTDLVVVARQGTPDGKGGLSGIVDSPAVQITAATTGTRSLNAAAALRTVPAAGDAETAFLRVAQDASLFSGLGGTRPSLGTVGNVTADAGDSLGLRDLFSAGANAWDSVALYRVALRDDPSTPSGGRLLLRGEEVSGRTDFTPAEFNELQFVAGPDGARTDLVVVARQGTPDGKGGLSGIVDSPAVQITASTTGTRSINAAAALRTVPVADDAEATFLRVAQDAALFTGLGKTRPSLTTAIPADDPALSLESIATMPGAFRMAGSAAGASALDPALLYAGAVGTSRSNATTTGTAGHGALALALLLGNEVGGFRMAADAPDQMLLAVQAYQRLRG